MEKDIEENVDDDDIIVDDNVMHVNCAIEDINDAIRVGAQDNLQDKKVTKDFMF